MARRKTRRPRVQPDEPGATVEGLEELSFLFKRIKAGKVIPIVGNTVRLGHIFDIDFDDDLGRAGSSKELDEPAKGLHFSADEELAMRWAEQLEYPLPDNYKFARVAQYHSITNSVDIEDAKNKYLQFMKSHLLKVAENDPQVADVVEELREEINEIEFSELVRELGYPRFDEADEDPLRILARLPLPVYVTTSPFDFLEQALRDIGKRPRSQVFVWSDSPYVEELEEPEGAEGETADSQGANFDVQNPLIYHLHGHEAIPESMILSEDDYLEFLYEVSRDDDSVNRIIPHQLRNQLAGGGTLLLIGYRLQDWDFRVLFRGVLNPKNSTRRKKGIVIQIEPRTPENRERGKIQDYLETFFDREMFQVVWRKPDTFVQQLWRSWQSWVGGGG